VAVTDFSTKAAVVVRDDLAVWQRLNVTAFMVSGLIGAAEPEAIGVPYEDADGVSYLPLLVQPVLVFEATANQLRRARARAANRGVTLAIYTSEMFATGNDAETGRPLPRFRPTTSTSWGWDCGPATGMRTPCCAA
jgi:hypothetical protein